MSKKLVAYFSASGVTADVARTLAECAGAELYEIRPEVPYSRADLDYMDRNSRSTKEMQDPASRPALADREAHVAECDVIFVGFPIWWYTAPAIIRTFLEAYDFSGKTIVPFATSGGSGISGAEQMIQEFAPGATVKQGKLLNRRSGKAGLTAWLETLNL